MTRLTPTELMEAAALLIDALHCCDAEAIAISNRISQSHPPDGVQVLDDAETIIKAAANIVAGEIHDGALMPAPHVSEPAGIEHDGADVSRGVADA